MSEKAEHPGQRLRSSRWILATTLVVVGGVLASNMGFKISYDLVAVAPGVSKSGRQSLGLPYLRKPGLDNASHLLVDIPQEISAILIEKFDPLTDSNSAYPGGVGDFPLVSGEGYLLRVTTGGAYKIVGSHDPSVAIDLKAAAPGVSKSGRNHFAPPYHTIASTASELLADIPNSLSIERYDAAADVWDVYPGSAEDFPIVRGESYLVRVSANVTYTPMHY